MTLYFAFEKGYSLSCSYFKSCIYNQFAINCSSLARMLSFGAFCNENGKSELVSIMTATYSIVFPHRDGTRMVHVSGAYTKDNFRHQGYASTLLKAIERDARDYFHADYICCDSTANRLYKKNGFQEAPTDETRLWKQLF